MKETYIKTTGIFIINSKTNSLLLQHRDNKKNINFPNMWGTPGGTVNKNETFIACAYRELKEETNYDAKNLIFFKTYVYKFGNKHFKTKLYWEFYDNKTKLICNEGKKIKFIEKKNFYNFKIVHIVLKAWIELEKKYYL